MFQIQQLLSSFIFELASSNLLHFNGYVGI